MIEKITSCLFIICCLSINQGHGAYKLQERFSWNQLDFAFPSQRLKEQALARGDYIPQNALPVGIEHWGNKLFVTVPRWRDGIPATLTYIDLEQTSSGSPELIPYPDARSNTAGDCENSITTAYRIKADECGRLWVLDTGTLGIGNTTTNPCPYAVNVFDLATNTRIRRQELRPEDTNSNTFIANIAVDIGKNCDDAFAYFTDELGYGLIVYSWEQRKSWRFSGHGFFFPDPLRGDFNVAGLNFQWSEEGIFGMALSPIQSDGYRLMYFSPLASHREFVVSTKTLRDESKVETGYHEFVALDERGPKSHTTARVLDDSGVMLFNLIDQNAVGCWHSSLPYSPQFHGVVDRDDVGLVFPVDVKIDENKDVWVMSDRMPVFLLSELDFNDINFRIYSAPLQSLIEGTVCDVRANYIHPTDVAIKPVHPSIVTYQSLHQLQTIHSIPAVKELPKAKSTSIFAFPQSLKTTFLPPPQPASLLLTTQKVPVLPKAFIFNQHNGVNLEAASPHEYTTSGLGAYRSSLSKKGTNWLRDSSF